MATSYLLSRIAMGSIIKFNYTRPGVISGERVLLLLTPNWLGNLHGIKIAGLTPTEQEYLQDIFNSLYTEPENIYESIQDNMRRRMEEIQILNQKRADLLRKQQGVVMRPTGGGFLNQGIEAGKRAFGSIIGKISTFGRTQKEIVPQQNPLVEQEIQNNAQAIQIKQQEYAELVEYLKQEKTRWAMVGRIPRDPYKIYHQVIKPMFPSDRLSGMYRKYKVQFVSGERVIKSPGVTYAT